MNTIPVGVIGAGRWGLDCHCAMLSENEGYDLRAVCDPVERCRMEAKERFDVPTFAGMEEMFENVDVDIVVACVPPQHMYATVVQALQADKAVVVEKTFAQYPEQAGEMIALAEEKNRLLTVFFNRRWDSAYQAARNAVNDGLLGEIFSVHAQMHRFGAYQGATHWRTEVHGGCLLDLGPHLIDWVLQLVDDEPTEVYSVTQNIMWGTVSPDYAKVIVRFGHGALGQIDTSWTSAVTPNLLTVFGTKGTLVTDGQRTVADSVAITKDVNGQAVKMNIKAPAKNWEAFWENLRLAYFGKAELAIRAADGLNVVRVLAVAEASAKEHRVVNLTSERNRGVPKRVSRPAGNE